MTLEHSKTSLIDLNAECSQRVIKHLSDRDIMALSIASCLWFKDVPLVYEEITAYQERDIDTFLTNCGIYLKSFIVDKPNHSDVRIYQMHQLLANFCPNLESIAVAFSEGNEYVERSFAALKNLENLKNLVYTIPFECFSISRKAALHLSELKCLPQLEMLKIHWTGSHHAVDLNKSIKQCQHLKTLHIGAHYQLDAEVLKRFESLEELKITEFEGEPDESQHKKAHRRPWAFYEAFCKLQKIKKLYLGGPKCLNVSKLRAIAELPLLTHLTLQNFALCQCDCNRWNAPSLLPSGALTNLEELHFIKVSYYGFWFNFMLLRLVRTCTKLKYVRLREINLLGSSLLDDIIDYMVRRIRGTAVGGPASLKIAIEDYEEHYRELKYPYSILAKRGILEIKFEKLKKDVK